MNKEELFEARERLKAFLEPLLLLIGRLERRRWGEFYIQGLLLEGGRKTAVGMAANYGGNVQAVQQFVNQSPWDWTPLRRQLAQQLASATSQRAAWILDDTGFPKKGSHSVGVARQYSGTLGKVGNCQIGVSLNYATDEGCFPMDFQLYLPEGWTNDPVRLKSAGIPDEVVFKRKWEIGLEMMDRAREWGIPLTVVVADAGYGMVTEFRDSLRQRGFPYVVGIGRDVGAWQSGVSLSRPVYQGRGRPRKRQSNLPPSESVLAQALSLPESAWHRVSWREGSKGPLEGRFAAVRVQPSHGHVRGKETEPESWLLVEWPSAEPKPTKFWISNLPEDTPLKELVYWAKIRWWVEQNYQQLKEEIGLDHFAGRSWTGWHHHVTLTMIAFGFLVLEGFRVKKNYWVDPPTRQKGVAEGSDEPPWFLPDVSRKGSS